MGTTSNTQIVYQSEEPNPNTALANSDYGFTSIVFEQPNIP
jgi:hypothetical protein